MDGAFNLKGTGSVTIYLYRRCRVVVDIPYAFPETFTEAVRGCVDPRAIGRILYQ